MKVEFIGTYISHETKKTSKDKDYIVLTCKQEFENKNVNVLLFNNKLFERLETFKTNDPITLIFETWYNSKTKQQVLLCKDVI